jgi:sec-independent protein translocase protein TatA
MFNQVGPLEVIVVLGIVLLIFGPKRLPQAGRALGKSMREFKDSISGSHKDDQEIEAPDADEKPQGAEQTAAAPEKTGSPDA